MLSSLPLKETVSFVGAFDSTGLVAIVSGCVACTKFNALGENVETLRNLKKKKKFFDTVF